MVCEHHLILSSAYIKTLKSMCAWEARGSLLIMNTSGPSDPRKMAFTSRLASWYERLVHLRHNVIVYRSRQNFVAGLLLQEAEKANLGSHVLLERTRTEAPDVTRQHDPNVLDIVHSYTCLPVNMIFKGCAKFVFMFINRSIKLAVKYPTKQKSYGFSFFKKYWQQYSGNEVGILKQLTRTCWSIWNYKVLINGRSLRFMIFECPHRMRSELLVSWNSLQNYIWVIIIPNLI